MNEALIIPSIQQFSTQQGSRIAASVDGVDAWFETGDTTLRPSAEAFASAFLIPAVALERQLTVQDPVAPDFAAGPGQVLDIVGEWWGYPRLSPSFGDAFRVPAQREREKGSTNASSAAPLPAPPPTAATALCFSGGVDSFYSLLASGRRIETLVFVHGFDITLDDSARAESFEQHFREIAAAVGARPVVIRTNLRAHGTFRAAPWGHSHGGALAAIGHLLADDVGTLLVSSSYPYTRPKKWGSHWELDPLWSGAGLTIEHIGAEHDRADKLAALKDEPLARHYLRVCWRNLSDQPNCSRCSKCLLTEVVLAALGVLDEFPVFEPTATLATRIDNLPSIGDPISFRHYEAALAMGLPVPIAGASRRLLARSRRALWRRRIEGARGDASALLRRLVGLPVEEHAERH